jgi:hypothetical protein
VVEYLSNHHGDFYSVWLALFFDIEPLLAASVEFD